jgi:hypothetical protein
VLNSNPNKVSLSALPPLALYIHFPWCEKKCPYCDFNSHQIKEGKAGFDEARYINLTLGDDKFTVFLLVAAHRAYSLQKAWINCFALYVPE